MAPGAAAPAVEGTAPWIDEKRPTGLRRALLTPERLVAIIGRRGGLYVKLGQFLATRPDLVAQDYCDALLELTDQVRPFRWEDARRVLVEDLGRPPQDCFAWIDPVPIGAASLSQVHLARTLAGDQVAIKIQRPGIRALADRQLRGMGSLLRVLEAAGVLPGIAAGDLHRELTRWLDDELDFRRELANVVQMARTFSGETFFQVPRPYPALSGTRVMVTGYMRGVPFSELLRLVSAGDKKRLSQLGFDVERLADNLIEAMLTQLFRYRLFHGDPHPGNLLALPGNVIGFIDCGLVHAVDERLRRQQGRYIEAVYAADPERIHDALMDLLEATSDASAEAFRSDLFAATRRWIERASCPDPPPQERSAIADYMIEVVRAAQRRGFRLPASALGMYRAMLTADSVASWLGSPLSIVRVGRAFFRRLRVDELVESLMPNASRVSALGLAADLASMPGNVSRLLSDLADERFVLEARTSDSAEDKRDADLRARLVTLGIMSVGFAILLAAAIARRPAAPLVVGFGLSLLACYVALFLTWRRLR